MTQLALLKALQRNGYHIEVLVDLEEQRREIERDQNIRDVDELLKKYAGKEVRWNNPELLDDLLGLSEMGLSLFWAVCKAQDLGRKVFFQKR